MQEPTGTASTPRRMHRVDALQARFPACARRAVAQADGRILRVRLPAHDIRVYQRPTLEIPAHAGVKVGDRVIRVDAQHADYAIAGDGTLAGLPAQQ